MSTRDFAVAIRGWGVNLTEENMNKMISEVRHERFHELVRPIFLLRHVFFERFLSIALCAD